MPIHGVAVPLMVLHFYVDFDAWSFWNWYLRAVVMQGLRLARLAWARNPVAPFPNQNYSLISPDAAGFSAKFYIAGLMQFPGMPPQHLLDDFKLCVPGSIRAGANLSGVADMLV